jgi:hypothetical protein
MVELGFSDMLSVAQTIGIVGTMVLTLYFSKRQIQSLSVDVESRVLNDLDEKIHRIGEMIIERPQLGKVITNIQTDRWLWTCHLRFMYSTSAPMLTVCVKEKY